MNRLAHSPRLVRGLGLLALLAALAAGWAAQPPSLDRSLPDSSLRILPVSQRNDDQNPPLPADALEGGIDWINSQGPIHLSDLKGKIVLLDFWTYCCINCHHILPDLEKLEKKYANQLVVIGVHTAKFDAEKDTENIRKKVAEYRIRHPVVNDANQVLWQKFGVEAWPTLALIDATGRYVGSRGGEGNYELFDEAIGKLVARHRKDGELDETPLHFASEADRPVEGALLYPGKVLADAAGNRLFITDTGHNRIVVTDLDGKHQATIGSGAAELKDGPYAEAGFNRPQGTCLVGNTLYVADTENHAIRAVDLETQTVTTLAGNGRQAPFRSRGGPARSAELNSPWDVLPDPRNPDRIFIAMAGPHQIWALDKANDAVAVWAGSGIENIIDGSRTEAAFAQPSGLATDGAHLFVADSEVSGIRAVNFKTGAVSSIVGQGLFEFGDIDGQGDRVRLQHCLGLAYGDGTLYIADSYNNKIKACDPRTRSVRTLLGSRQSGLDDDPPMFDEPGGLSLANGTLYVADTNNHAIRAVDLQTRAVRTLALDSVSKPTPPKRPPSFPNATPVAVAETRVAPGEKFTLQVNIAVPEGYKVSPDAPMPYLLQSEGGQELALGTSVSPTGATVDPPAASFQVEVPLSRPAKPGDTLTLKLSAQAFLCQAALCKIHSYVWTIPVTFAEDAGSTVELTTPPAEEKAATRPASRRTR